MAYTTMKTWASLDVLTAAELNTYLRDNIEYLKAQTDSLAFSGAQVARTSAQSIPNSSATPITWQTASYEYDDWWSSGTDVVVPADAIPAGYTTVSLLVTCRARFVANGTGGRYIHLLKNGTAFGGAGVSAVTGDTTDVNVIDFVVAEAGDIITAQVTQASGGALNMDVGNMTVVKFAPAT